MSRSRWMGLTALLSVAVFQFMLNAEGAGVLAVVCAILAVAAAVEDSDD